MESNEIIQIQLPDKQFDTAIYDSLEYAILSIPFTINRMEIQNLSTRIINIAKGKLSEIVFKEFCITNEIPIRIDLCETPFFQPDKKDFILGNEEWDLKNNFLFHGGPTLNTSEYLKLPALIPNRGKWDQWSKRNTVIHKSDCDESIILFSFMKGWDLKGGKRDNPFLSFQISDEQSIFLKTLQIKYSRKKIKHSPFSKTWFWNEMKKWGDNFIYHANISYRPTLILMGYSNTNSWGMFETITPKSLHSRNFAIRIKNKGANFKNLKSFLSLYPHLKDNIQYGVILK